MPARNLALLVATLFLADTIKVDAQTAEIQQKVERQLQVKKLQGAWVPYLLVTTQGAEAYPLTGRALHFDRSEFTRIEGKRVVVSGSFEIAEGFLRLTVKDRKPWDLEAGEAKGKTQYAFKITGDILTLCYSVGNKGKAGDLTPGTGRQVVVYKRDQIPEANKAEMAAVRIREILETPISTNDLPKEISLAKLLEALEAKLPAGKKLALRIDREAFGKQVAAVADAPIKIRALKNVSAGTVLRLALSEVAEVEEVDFAFRPSGVVITRPRLAVHEMIYDVRDIIPELPRLLPELREQIAGPFKGQAAELLRGIKAGDGAAILARFLVDNESFQPWESVQLLNGARLRVLASPTRQDAVFSLLEALRRLSHVDVVMNARLYEVDRSFYKKHVAPRFAGDQMGKEPPAVVSINGPLFKRISGQKLVLGSENVKIKANQVARFLSRQTVFRYSDGGMTGSGLAGVSFDVRPLISPDRRFLRLGISQKVTQLVGINKIKRLSASSGKEVQIESPNLLKKSVTGSIDIPDAGAILMPVAYPPTGKDNEDKVWLLVARPFIWIEEEVQEIRKGGGDVTLQSIWDGGVPDEEMGVPPRPLPDNDDVSQILQGIITDVLMNPKLKQARAPYQTDRTITLDETGNLGWPKKFKPETGGYTLVTHLDPFMPQQYVLGIRLKEFDMKQKNEGVLDAPIEVTLFNAGRANSPLVTVSYLAKRVGKRWILELAQVIDH
jgi:hypothetical protein